MELTTRIPGLALALFDSLMPTLRRRSGTCERNIERPDPGDDRLRRDIGIPSLRLLNEPERGYAADLVARYGKVD